MELAKEDMKATLSILSSIMTELKEGLFTEGQRVMIRGHLRNSQEQVFKMLATIIHDEQASQYWHACLQCFICWGVILGEQILSNQEIRKRIIGFLKREDTFEVSIDLIVCIFSYQKLECKLVAMSEIIETIGTDVANMISNPNESYNSLLYKISELFVSMCQSMFNALSNKCDVNINALTIIYKLLSYPNYLISYSTFEFWTSFREYLKSVRV
jgi:hypothetical protein